MNHPTPLDHRVYLVDLEQPLMDVLKVLADHCDEGKMYSPQDVLMLAIHFLTIEYNTEEAIEAMKIDVHTYCSYRHTQQLPKHMQHTHMREQIDYAVRAFITEMHRLFKLYRFYDPNGFLCCTFGGWHGEYVPVFVPYTHIYLHPNAISGIVESEPVERHPGKIFYPYPAPEVDPVLPW